MRTCSRRFWSFHPFRTRPRRFPFRPPRRSRSAKFLHLPAAVGAYHCVLRYKLTAVLAELRRPVEDRLLLIYRLLNRLHLLIPLRHDLLLGIAGLLIHLLITGLGLSRLNVLGRLLKSPAGIVGVHLLGNALIRLVILRLRLRIYLACSRVSVHLAVG